MPNSKYLAALIGPCLIAITLSEAANIRIFAGNALSVVYLNGTILFVAGFAIVRAHNVWTWRWPVAVTLIGWLAMILGLCRMFAPQLQADVTLAAQYPIIFAVFVAGCFLTFNGYVAGGRNGEREL